MDAKRDWGFAGDYVEAMWMMLNHSEPEDFVIATGETHTVKEFCPLAFQAADINIEWDGSGLDEKRLDKKTGKILVRISREFYRPAEVAELVGNGTKAREVLG